MKILIVTQYFYPETFRVNTLSRELVERGHEVTVLTGYPQYPYGKIYPQYGFNIPYEKDWNGVRIERLKVLPRGKNIITLFLNCYTYVLEGYKWVRRCKEKYDLIYVFGLSPITIGLPAIKYKKKFNTPVLFNVQDLWPESVTEVLGIRNKLVVGVIDRIVDKIYKHSDKILCSSRGFIENIACRGVERDKLVYWPQFCLSPEEDTQGKPDCYDNNYFNIVFAGNIGNAQGLELLIEAAERIKDTPVRWHLVGDGRAKEQLSQLVADKGLEKNVLFMGKVSEKEANYYVKYADCAYLSFSDNKLFDMTVPAKLQTYLACGVPVLGAVGGESAKIIEEAQCGLITEKDPDSVANAVLQMMNAPRGTMDMYKENAVKYFEQHYQMERLVSSLEKLMNKYKQK